MATRSPIVTGGASSETVSAVSFRALANPAVELAPAHEQGTPGRTSYEPGLEQWSADGTYLVMKSDAGLTAGGYVADVSLVSLVTGRPIQASRLDGGHLSTVMLRLAGPLYTLQATHLYNGPEQPTDQSLVVQNVDGSEKTTLYAAKVMPNVEHNDVPIRTAQVVQVVAP